MIIGIDARPLIEKKSGIGIYIEKVLQRLLELDGDNQYYLFSDESIYFESNATNIHKLVYDNKGLPGTIYFEIFLHKYMKKNNILCDVFWGTQQYVPFRLPKNCKAVLTIHDLAYKICPHTVNNKILIMLKLFARTSIKRADRIICVSSYTETMLKKYYYRYMVHKDCRVIYISGSLDDNDLKLNNELSKAYLLFIGNIEPRKNLQVLLEAYKKCKNNIDIDLIICGKIGWKSEEIHKIITQDSSIEYLNYVSEEKKKELLTNAFALVLPSKYEGFGIPAVEAMKCGTIPIVANNSSMKEIVEQENLRFETMDSEDLKNKICALYNNKDLYIKMKDYCEKRGKVFSWKITGDKTFQTLLNWK